MIPTAETNLKFQTVKFIDRSLHIPIKRVGWIINEYVVICGSENSWQVYSSRTGKLLYNGIFETARDAVLFSNWYVDLYGEAIPIWENDDWVGVDLVGLMRYTVPDGLKIYNALQLARKQLVTVDKINSLILTANDYE